MKSLLTKTFCFTVLFLFLLSVAEAHLGSNGVFHEGMAGPYKVMITVSPPLAIPGVAQLQVRSTTPDVETVQVCAYPLTGAGSKIMPHPVTALRSKEDRQFFTSDPWLMTPGSWQLRIMVEGSKGAGEISIPVPSLPQQDLRFPLNLAIIYISLFVLMFSGALAIAHAALRESHLKINEQVTRKDVQRGRKAVLVAVFLFALMFVYEALLVQGFVKMSEGRIYKPLQIKSELQKEDRLLIHLDPEEKSSIPLDDLIPDHNYYMHLFLIRIPEMDRLFHLHPEKQGLRTFLQNLPPVPAGKYQVLADVVHENGLAETAVGEITLPELTGNPLTGDDAAGVAPPLSTAGKISNLADGTRMVWLNPDIKIKSKTPIRFQFRLENSNGKPVEGIQPYMGMAGHAMFVRSDLTVFAHVHPSSSIPMAALQVTQSGSMQTDPHAGHMMMQLPPEVSFVYGFPQAGRYRIFVQVKRNNQIETGSFDTVVE